MSPTPLGILASARHAAASTITDNFNRADGALGTTDTGQTWSVVSSTGVPSSGFSIASNKATTTSAADIQHATVPAFTNASVSVIIAGARSYPGLLVRFTDVNNYYRIIYNPGVSLWELRRMLAGTDTVIGSYAGSVPSSATTVLLQVSESSSTDLLVQIGGITRITYSDTTSGRPAGSRVGLHKGWSHAAGTISTWDDFTVEAS